MLEAGVFGEWKYAQGKIPKPNWTDMTIEFKGEEKDPNMKRTMKLIASVMGAEEVTGIGKPKKTKWTIDVSDKTSIEQFLEKVEKDMIGMNPTVLAASFLAFAKSMAASAASSAAKASSSAPSKTKNETKQKNSKTSKISASSSKVSSSTPKKTPSATPSSKKTTLAPKKTSSREPEVKEAKTAKIEEKKDWKKDEKIGEKEKEIEAVKTGEKRAKVSGNEPKIEEKVLKIGAAKPKIEEQDPKIGEMKPKIGENRGGETSSKTSIQQIHAALKFAKEVQERSRQSSERASMPLGLDQGHSPGLFYLQTFLNISRDDLKMKQIIEREGGRYICISTTQDSIVMKICNSSVFFFVVAPRFLSESPLFFPYTAFKCNFKSISPVYVTRDWLKTVVKEKKSISPSASVLYQPLPFSFAHYASSMKGLSVWVSNDIPSKFRKRILKICKIISLFVSPRFTHLISIRCSKSSERESKKLGYFVVNPNWIEMCAIKGFPVNESLFELKSDGTQQFELLEGYIDGPTPFVRQIGVNPVIERFKGALQGPQKRILEAIDIVKAKIAQRTSQSSKEGDGAKKIKKLDFSVPAIEAYSKESNYPVDVTCLLHSKHARIDQSLARRRKIIFEPKKISIAPVPSASRASSSISYISAHLKKKDTVICFSGNRDPDLVRRAEDMVFSLGAWIRHSSETTWTHLVHIGASEHFAFDGDVLASLANGCWIVELDWLENSFRLCRFVSEIPFEMRREKINSILDARVCRLAVETLGHGLFEGMRILVILLKDFSDDAVAWIRVLLKSGAHVSTMLSSIEPDSQRFFSIQPEYTLITKKEEFLRIPPQMQSLLNRSAVVVPEFFIDILYNGIEGDPRPFHPTAKNFSLHRKAVRWALRNGIESTEQDVSTTKDS